jgi:hypothetical protein
MTTNVSDVSHIRTIDPTNVKYWSCCLPLLRMS